MSKYENAILFAGYPASGKSTALNVCKGFGEIFCYEMGDFVREKFNKTTGEDISDNELGDWATTTRNTHGVGCFAEQLVDKISHEVPETKSVAVSGVRAPEEVSAFIESNLFNDVTVIAVVANESVRWERFTEGEDSSRKEFTQQNTCEQRWGVDRVIRKADLYMRNEWTTEQRFRNKIEGMIESLLTDRDQSWV